MGGEGRVRVRTYLRAVARTATVADGSVCVIVLLFSLVDLDYLRKLVFLPRTHIH